MKHFNLAKRLFAGAAFVSAVALSGSAFAGPKIFAYSGNWITFNGSVETNVNNNVDPFLVEVFSSGGECLRVALSQQGSDLEARLTAPNGTNWRDDDSNGNLRPLIKAITTQRGWYVLSISSYNGAPVNSDFTAYVWRFPSNHPSCVSPTAPTSLAAAGAKAAAAPTMFKMPANGAQK